MNTEQINTIVTAIKNANPVNEQELNQLMMMYVLDMTFDRGAICEATRILKEHINNNNQLLCEQIDCSSDGCGGACN